MPVICFAVKRFAHVRGEAWEGFVKWPGQVQVREGVSLVGDHTFLSCGFLSLLFGPLIV